MQRVTEEHYFNVYMTRFSEPEFAKALSSCPGCMVPDDHDYFDGKGSHETKYNTCPVYEGICKVAQRFRLLFQLAHTEATARAPTPHAGFVGEGSFSFVYMAGDDLMLIGVDGRSERLVNEAEPARSQMTSPRSWDLIFARAEAAPRTCRHALVIFGAPVVFPDLKGLEQVVEGLSEGAAAEVLAALLPSVRRSPQRRLDLKDDLRDQPGSPYNRRERDAAVARLHDLARRRAIRVTFVGGDVHLGGFGFMCSAGPHVDPASDHRFAMQWISSPITNLPASGALKNLLAGLGLRPEPVGTGAEMRLHAQPRADHAGRAMPAGRALVARRNYLRVDREGAALAAELWVEGDGDRPFEAYRSVAPPLNPAAYPVV
jgi:hypothetical protein